LLLLFDSQHKDFVVIVVIVKAQMIRVTWAQIVSLIESVVDDVLAKLIYATNQLGGG
jgi:hypothetical protein